MTQWISPTKIFVLKLSNCSILSPMLILKMHMPTLQSLLLTYKLLPNTFKQLKFAFEFKRILNFIDAKCKYIFKFS
ncbi:hypothetical protein, partial [Enterobacter cloacae complex sp. 4DZ3-17B2]|uniref:hypothetical protein n=1 Tax=Enterobacter cloacae complex sp. 4DZ3-17B2 TaxID=2511990 RepID=UPI001CA5324E